MKERKILGASLDVFEKEPYHGKFIKLKNVLLSPHIGSYAAEIRNEMEIEASKKIILNSKLWNLTKLFLISMG